MRGLAHGLEGPVQRFGLAAFAGVLPRSTATVVRVAATDGVAPRQPTVETAVVSAKPRPTKGCSKTKDAQGENG